MGYSPRGHKESDATEATWHAPTKSEVKVWVGPSGGPRENLFRASLLASSGLQQSLAVPLLVVSALVQSLPPPSHGLLCGCVSSSVP